MDLNELFDEEFGGDEASDKVKTHWAKWDRKKTTTQFIRLRFLEDLSELKRDARVTHKIDGITYNCRCNLKMIKDSKNPGKVFLWDGWSKGVNKNPEHNCKFCADMKALKKLAEETYGKDTPQAKEAVIKANRLFERSQQLVVNVEYEVWERKAGAKKPVKVEDARLGLLGVRINDLFSTMGKGEYATLDAFYQNKGSICEHWWTMDRTGKLTPDDPVKETEVTQYDLFDKPKVMDYEEALERFLARKGHADQGEPTEAPDDDEDYDQIPF